MIAAAGDAAYLVHVGAADGLFPERRPMRGIILVSPQQFVHQPYAFIGRLIFQKPPRLSRSRDDADYVEIRPPQKSRIAGKRRRRLRLIQTSLCPLGADELID